VIVVVSGSRFLTCQAPVADVLARLDRVDTLFHGDQRGVDSLAAEYALSRGWTVCKVEADWHLLDGDAGPVRNAEMLCMAKRMAAEKRLPVALYAFPSVQSRGTRNCIALARLLKVPVAVTEVAL
jgi:hypothetical protein